MASVLALAGGLIEGEIKKTQARLAMVERAVATVVRVGTRYAVPKPPEPEAPPPVVTEADLPRRVVPPRRRAKPGEAPAESSSAGSASTESASVERTPTPTAKKTARKTAPRTATATAKKTTAKKATAKKGTAKKTAAKKTTARRNPTNETAE